MRDLEYPKLELLICKRGVVKGGYQNQGPDGKPGMARGDGDL